MDEEILIYCPDCRGEISFNFSEMDEDDVIDCDICGAEMVVGQKDPLKIRLVTDEDF